MRRKTRFVCVSDTHGYTPSEAGFKLPAGDVLIHAGDLTNNGSMSELRRTMDWISKADFEIKIIVAGNHDVSLDPEFYAQHGHTFHGQRLEDPQQCIDIITGATPSIVLLRHQTAVIRLTRENGPCTVFTVFGSPFSQSKGNWAFGYESSKAAALWNHIPPEVDIVVTHTPPHYYCDQKPDGKFVGCHALRDKMSRIRPLLAICGHVHEGRGYSRVRWQNVDTLGTGSEGDPGIRGHIDRVTHDPLPPRGSKKLNLVDLTGKRRDPLDNHGFSREVPGVDLFPEPANSSIIPSPDNVKTTGGLLYNTQSNREVGNLLSLRKETCIINAAIMATSWPHRGGKQFNAPIVVDIELPTWCSQEKESRGYQTDKLKTEKRQ